MNPLYDDAALSYDDLHTNYDGSGPRSAADDDDRRRRRQRRRQLRKDEEDTLLLLDYQ